jgi:hypothetical protein
MAHRQETGQTAGRVVVHEMRPGREAPSYQAGMSTNANGLAVGLGTLALDSAKVA